MPNECLTPTQKKSWVESFHLPSWLAVYSVIFSGTLLLTAVVRWSIVCRLSECWCPAEFLLRNPWVQRLEEMGFTGDQIFYFSLCLDESISFWYSFWWSSPFFTDIWMSSSRTVICLYLSVVYCHRQTWPLVTIWRSYLVFSWYSCM